MKNARTTMLRLAVLAIAILLSGSLSSATAQIRSGTITGGITDSAGAMIPAAEITILNEETGESLQSRTSNAGVFSIPYLPAGRYALTVEKAGFAPAKRTGLLLATGQTIRVDISLALGEIATTVDVVATAVALQTESATVQNTTSENLIGAMPNINHNPLYYATLQPGVVGRSRFNDTTNINSFGLGVDGRRFFSAISVNGAQAFSADIQVDGLSVQGSAWNEATIIPNQDGLQEVKTITNSYSAEYGRGAGIVQLSTKSGTNEFHGSAAYRARNEAFNANTFDNNARGLARLPFKVHSYTGSIGGPIIRNRAFFFISYEGLQHSRALDFLRTVPTEAERVGDFSRTVVNAGGSAVPIELYNPLTATQVANNVFRRERVPNSDLRTVPGLIHPAMLRLFSFYPKPNRTPDDVFGTNNFYARRAQTFERNSVNSRLDYKLGQHSLYGSFGLNRGGITTPGAWGNESPFYNPFQFIGAENQDDNPYGQIGMTAILKPNFVADLRYGVTRIKTLNKAYPGSDSFDYNQFDIPAAIQAINAVPNAPPEFQPGGNLSPLSSTGSLYKQEGQTNHNLNLSATWLRGRWTHKFGGEYRVYLSNYDDAEFSMFINAPNNLTREFISATGDDVTPGGVVIDARNSGWGPAAALMGFGRIQVSGARNPKPAFAQKYVGLYTQNDWKATERLTVSLGLRWDLQPGLTDRFDRIRSIDLTQTNVFGMQGAWVFPGVNGASRNLYETQWKNFGPRASVAYRFGESTVVRAGYGLTYLPSNTGFFATGGFYGMDAFAPTTLNNNAVIWGTSPSGRPVGRFNEVNVIIPPIGPNSAAPEFYGVSNFAYFPRNGYQNAYLQQWNFTVERKLSNHWVASAGYVGSRGVHLPFARFPINSDQFLDPGLLARCRADYIARNGAGQFCTDLVDNPWQPAGDSLINFGGELRNSRISTLSALQRFPAIAGSGLSLTNGWSNHHSLQLAARRTLANGLEVNANYVWSKTLAFNLSEAQGNAFGDGVGFTRSIDVLNLRNNYALASTDIPHRLVVAGSYELPFGGSSRFRTGNRALDFAIAGWRTSGVWVIQSGTPFAIGGASNGAINGRPNLVPGVPLEVPKELQKWYDSPNTADRTVTLPSGRSMIVCRFCFLKYNPDAFAGQVITLPNGQTLADVHWWGNAAQSYDALRQPNLNNLNVGVDRVFRLQERLQLEFSAQVTNILNHTQFRPTFNGNLGNTQTNPNPAAGRVAGLGTNDNFGTFNTGTYDPRQIEFHLRVRF